jgi:hypothetical protein
VNYAARDKAACAEVHERKDDRENAHDEEIVVVATGASMMEQMLEWGKQRAGEAG